MSAKGNKKVIGIDMDADWMGFDTEMSLRLMAREEICHVGEKSPKKERRSPGTDKFGLKANGAI